MTTRPDLRLSLTVRLSLRRPFQRDFVVAAWHALQSNHVFSSQLRSKPKLRRWDRTPPKMRRPRPISRNQWRASLLLWIKPKTWPLPQKPPSSHPFLPRLLPEPLDPRRLIFQVRQPRLLATTKQQHQCARAEVVRSVRLTCGNERRAARLVQQRKGKVIYFCGEARRNFEVEIFWCLGVGLRTCNDYEQPFYQARCTGFWGVILPWSSRAWGLSLRSGSFAPRFDQRDCVPGGESTRLEAVWVRPWFEELVFARLFMIRSTLN